MLGWVIAALVRQIHHRDPRRKVGGVVAVTTFALVALFWNLLVAHYREALRDPVDQQQLAVSTYNRLHAWHTDLCDYARDLEKSCRGALDRYRNENREARSTDAPLIWQAPWSADWDLPEAPAKSDLPSEAEAEERSREMHRQLEEREQRLRDCHEECRELVNEITRLDPHHKAVPA